MSENKEKKRSFLARLFGKDKEANKKQPEDEREKHLYDLDDFNIDIKRGLYIGPGVKLLGSEEETKEVKPMFINWGDLAGHLAVYGTTRVGKTRLMVSLIRQCILRGMDIFVIEPKGAVGAKVTEDEDELGAGQETLSWILQFAEEAGRLDDVKYISPMFPSLSLHFNPLFGMSNEEIASLVATIVPAKEEFFTAMGYQITMAIMLGLDYIEKSRGQEYIDNLIADEYSRIFGSDSYTNMDDDDLTRPDLVDRATGTNERIMGMSHPPSRTLVTFIDISRLATQKGIKALRDLVKMQNSFSYNVNITKDERKKLETLREQALIALDDMVEKDAGYYSKVSTSFNLIISQLSSGRLGELLCSCKINPILDGLANTKRGQIVVVQPFPLIFKSASDAFVRIFFAILTSYYGNIGASGRKSPRETAMFVDEGGAVLYKGVENLFNKAGGLGMRIFIFTQSFADYESELGPEVAKIVNDNTNIKMYMRMNDNISRKTVAESFGDIRVDNNKYMGSKTDIRITAVKETREILLPAHMGDMQKQEFLLQYGEGRFYCVAPYQSDPDYAVRVPMLDRERVFKEMSGYTPTLSLEAEDKVIEIFDNGNVNA
jgi:DNA transfer in the process of conjugation and F pilus assembly protein